MKNPQFEFDQASIFIGTIATGVAVNSKNDLIL
jgi:hypothetical protein